MTILSIMHAGSGIGNQLHRYVACRALAYAKGCRFGVIAPELFKAKDFIKAEMGEEYHDYAVEYGTGKVVPSGMFMAGDCILDNESQNERIFFPIIDKVRKWLPTEPLEMPDDLCVINFRGGEYKVFPELFLPKEYWNLAIKMMKEENPNMKFEVHTDDEEEAKKFFPDFKCIHDAGLNWRSIRYAKYLILSNSSFNILPAYMNENVKKVICPKYWARYNTKEWINPDNATYSKFTYIHHDEKDIS
jgi:hypothetical protein